MVSGWKVNSIWYRSWRIGVIWPDWCICCASHFLYEWKFHHSRKGNQSKVRDFCNENVAKIKIATLDWYSGINGYVFQQVPCLAIGYENGKLQLMRHEKDKTPLVVDTQMKDLRVRWNHNGSLLAATGIQFVRSSSGEEKEICVLQIYNPSGQVFTHVFQQRAASSHITFSTWNLWKYRERASHLSLGNTLAYVWHSQSTLSCTLPISGQTTNGHSLHLMFCFSHITRKTAPKLSSPSGIQRPKMSLLGWFITFFEKHDYN